MRIFTAVLVAVVLYMPYQQHYPLILPIKGLNIINVIFLGLLAAIMMRPEKAKSRTPLKGRIIFLMVMATISFLVGVLTDSSRFEDDLTALKNNLFYMLFFFLFYHAMRDRTDVRIVFGAILLVTCLIGLHGLRQAFDLGMSNFADNKRVNGPFGIGGTAGANVLAGYLIIFLPMLFVVFLLAKSRPWIRLVALGGLGLGVATTFFTYSRQAYVLLAALLLGQGMRRNLVVGLFVLGGLLTYELWAPASVLQRIEMTTQEDDTGDEKLEESAGSRFMLWEGGAQMIAEQPWGVGLNQFRRNIGRYAPKVSGKDAHNGYVLMAAEAGVLGLLAMVMLLLGLLGLALKIRHVDDTEDTRVLSDAFTLAVVGVMFSNLFGSRFFDGQVMGNFWALAGAAARYYTLEMERRAEVAEANAPAGTPVAAAA